MFFTGVFCGAMVMGYFMKIKELKYLQKLQLEHTIIDNETKLPIRIFEI